MIFTLFPTAVKAETPAAYATISINGGTAVDISGYGTTTNDYYTGTLVQVLNDIADKDKSDVVINIPEGVTLWAGVMADQGNVGANTCVGIPKSLKSLTFTGSGLLSINGNAGPAIFFNGVPTVINGISIGRDVISNGTTTHYYASVFGGTSHTKADVNGTVDNKYCAGALESTSITLISGTVGSINAGSMNTDVTTTNLTISGGTVSTSVTGGNGLLGSTANFPYSDGGGIITTVNITMTGGTLGSSSGGYIYGSSIASAKTVNISVTGGTISYIFGGSGVTSETTNVTFGGTATARQSIYGGGFTGSSVTKQANVTITGGFVGDSVYGGGFTNSTTAKAVVKTTGGYVARCIHGGSYHGSVTESDVTVDGTIFLTNGVYSAVFGGGKYDDAITGKATVNVKKAYNCRTVSGGGLSTAKTVSETMTTNIASVNVDDLYVIDNSAVTLVTSSTIATPLEALTADLKINCDNIYVNTSIVLAGDLPASTSALITLASGKSLTLGAYSITNSTMATGGGLVKKTVGSYTASINYAGGKSDINGITVSNSDLTLPTVSKDGYVFNGWTDGTNDYAANTAFTVTADITLTPKFVLSGGVDGHVTDGTDAVSGAAVKLQQGSTIVASTTTDANGDYLFKKVNYDTYNLVI